MLGLGLGLGLALGGQKLLSMAVSRLAAPPVEPEVVASATVTTVRSQSTPIRQTIETNGTVEAFDLLSVSPRAGGLQIRSVNVREGDRVAAGQILAVLDDSVLRSQIEQARAQVGAAIATVEQRQAEAAQAQASLAAARENFDRYNSLFEQGAISAESLTEKRTAVATEEQTLGAQQASIASAQASVRSAQAEVERLETQLDQTLVIAPSDGVIAERAATVGDTASVGTPLFELISNDELELAVEIPQAQMAQVTPGTPVQISSNSDANLQLQGFVRSIDPTVDAQTRKATVKVGLPGSDRLRPGMFLQAAIVIGTREGVTVPAAAVLPQSSGGFVVYQLAADSTVSAQAVRTGEQIPASGGASGGEPAQIEIVSGLQADVPVVLEGASYVQDGDLVNVVSNQSDLEDSPDGVENRSGSGVGGVN
ncbi:efflux RND transporter periplasmic adaptor subunit [cf. Phormidesmis sp. LEGE 11477]|nr:efflux RND transporter periplasmic adaptor subunit [cf. Phormidesmis sp. LEGE 11477]